MAIVSTNGIAITGGADINITDSQKITGVGKAISAREAARLSVTESTAGTVTTKEYVDQEIATDPVVFSIDITGLGTSTALQNAVATYLDDLYPAATLNANKVARIHTTSYAGATVEGVDVESAKNVSYISVDSNGTQNESVVQDVVFDAGGASGNVILTPARTMMTYKSNGTAWIYQSTTVYP
jgi:galactitol-specific phosphotransferase system IIB component